MLEGCSLWCMTFVRIVSSMSYRHAYPSLVRQYTRTMNRSSFRMISSDMFTVYGNDRVTKLAVISGHASQAFHADLFPRLAKYYVTSQPMNA